MKIVRSVYLWTSSNSWVQLLERVFVYIAIISFLVHLLLIFLSSTFTEFSVYKQVVGDGYLSSLSTPFTVILYFEIFLLLISIPKSLLKSILIQYEIVSLIILRNVFKDIAKIEDIAHSFFSIEVLGKIVADMAGALVIFLMVALFARLSTGIVKGELFQMSKQYVRIKQYASGALALLMLFFLVPGLVQLIGIIFVPQAGVFSEITFYKDFFTFLIFADVLLLLLSLIYTDDYGVVFLYAGFIVSTILIRISFLAGGFLETGLSVLAVFFGLAVLYLYKQFYYLDGSKQIARTSQEA